MKRNGNADRDEAPQAPRASAAGARIEAPRGGVWGGGVRLPTRGGGWGGGSPLPRNFFDFGSQYGEFWCIFDGIFYSSATCFKRKTGVQPLYRRINKSRDGE